MASDPAKNTVQAEAASSSLSGLLAAGSLVFGGLVATAAQRAIASCDTGDQLRAAFAIIALPVSLIFAFMVVFRPQGKRYWLLSQVISLSLCITLSADTTTYAQQRVAGKTICAPVLSGGYSSS